MAQHSMLEWLAQHAGRDYGNFINGEWTTSRSGKLTALYNPGKKGQLLGRFQDSTEADVDQAVQAAHQAFQSWSRVPGAQRAAILLRYADLLERDADELAYRLSAEQGKILAEARGEVGRAAKETRFAAGEALRGEGQTHPGERANVWNSTIHYPIGVIAAIAPWNFPVVTPVRKIIPALAYGCTVVFKPASNTPWTTIRLFELLAEAGVPAGVANLVTGGGARVGDPLVKHPLVRGISFTGSTELGIAIHEIASRRLARTQLELGGKNPAIVLDYEQVEHVAKQIVSAAFACSGQRCTAISRVVVLQEKAEELTAAIVAEASKLRVGPAWEADMAMGPLVSKSHLESVLDYVAIGQEEGARLLFGGTELNGASYSEGYYMTPAVFDQVHAGMRIAREEIFGPVLTIQAVADFAEAIAVANDTEYGLAASIFTSNLREAYQFAEQIQSGMVHINHGTASEAHMPFGGVKQSGFGAYSIGSSNKAFFTETKVIYVQY